eukprot:1158470-Pelagomonas_calceolata.AAC.8
MNLVCTWSMKADILEHRQEQIKAEEVKLRSMQAQRDSIAFLANASAGKWKSHMWNTAFRSQLCMACTWGQAALRAGIEALYGCCTIAVPVSLDLGMDKHPEGELLQASPVYIRKMVLADEPSI